MDELQGKQPASAPLGVALLVRVGTRTASRALIGTLADCFATSDRCEKALRGVGINTLADSLCMMYDGHHAKVVNQFASSC